ncbi:RyR domain-containing protein [Pseudomonas sp. C11]|uniref:RyR domain-containing protein n=1 Tax=Pseudomonas sp. C11 TaxID=3075550 RepID=UPI002B000DDE|nr:RyR domain-containing protein [Pseudomonas sp. C11]
MKVIVIAGAAHALIASISQVFGDTAVAWEDAGESYQQGIIAGVTAYFENPDMTPELEHQKWLEAKQADGWVHGEAIDTTPKTHPLLLPFAELPVEHRVKAAILHAAVHALKDLPDADEAAAAAVAAALAKVAPGQTAQSAPAGPGKLAVVYIGRKPAYTDHLYGTGLSFTQGQERAMPVDIARKFLRHPDMFKEGDATAVTEAQAEPDKVDDQDDDTARQLAEAKKLEDEQRDKENRILDLKQQINVMTKESLAEYAMTNYKQNLDKRKSVAELRQAVTGMIDQFGVV